MFQKSIYDIWDTLLSGSIEKYEGNIGMKKLFAKTSGRIAVAVVAIVLLLIGLVAFLASRDRNTSTETPKVVGDAGLSTTETPEPETSEHETSEPEAPEPETPEAEVPETKDPEVVEQENCTSEVVDKSEADVYYQENSTIIRIVDANESKSVHTEEEVTVFLSERGFTDYPITYEFAMGGEYVGETEISGDAGEKRPMYQTYYKSDSEEFWSIFVINGVIIAKPLSFNLESSLPAELLISESEETTSYDYKTNKYYVTIPYESAVIVKEIERIDADTLSQLTTEEINKLVEE